MDKCLPLGAFELFQKSYSPSSKMAREEDVASSPIILEDMSLFYYRQLADSLQVSAWHYHRFRNRKCFGVKLLKNSYPSFLTYVLGAQKNRLIKTVLLSTHNIYFG